MITLKLYCSSFNHTILEYVIPLSKDDVMSYVQGGIIKGVICPFCNNEAKLVRSDNNSHVPLNWIMIGTDHNGNYIYDKFTWEKFYV